MSTISEYVEMETHDPSTTIYYGPDDDPFASARIYARLINGERVAWH